MEELQVPRGPKHLKCPWWRKPMSQVCHTCPMWVQLRGESANTGKEIDHWSCAFRFMPELSVAVVRSNAQATAATNGVRNVLTSMVVNRVNKERLAQQNGKPALTRD